jgi:hypothetical protein
MAFAATLMSSTFANPATPAEARRSRLPGCTGADLVREIPEAHETATHRDRRPVGCEPDRSGFGLGVVHPSRLPIAAVPSGRGGANSTSPRLEATMPPTTANDDNIFDFKPRLRLRASHGCRCGPHLRKACHPRFVGIGRVGDRVVSGVAGAQRPESASHYRRNTRRALHAGRRPTQSAGRQADAATLDRTTRSGVGGSHGKSQSAVPGHRDA